MTSSISKPTNECLEHFLRNKKAQRWIFCEWFYSDIDWCLWRTENEFHQCLQHFFPQLVDRETPLVFNRRQWNFLRRQFGKPRRFSSSYLANEREKLSKQRNLLRIVRYENETNYRSDQIFLNHLPSTIISPLKSADRLLVRLFRQGQFSLHRGQFLRRLDENPSEYQILFDDSTIGLINVNENDVMRENPREFFSLTEKLQSMKFNEKKQMIDDDDEEEKIDLFNKIPDHLLFLIIRVSRILCAKRDAVENLRQMNDQAIYERSEQIPLSDAFRRNYAQLIQWLAKLNEFLGKFLEEINQISRQIVSDDQLLVLFNDTKYICDRSQRIAKELVQQLNFSQTDSNLPMVNNEKNLELITKLVALVVQMKEFSQSEGSFLELHAIDEANKNFQKFLRPSLLTTYKRCVESSLTQFKSGLHHRPGSGGLQSFLQMKSNSNDQQTNQTFFSV